MQNSAFIPPRRSAHALHHLLTWLLILGGLLLSPGLGPMSASAQEAPVQAASAQPVARDELESTKTKATGSAEFMSLEHRRELYDASRLTVAGAVGRNLLLPGLGNLYTEQYFYAGLAFSFLVFTASLVSYGLATDQSEFLWYGAGTAGLAYIGSISTSVIGVEKYNRKRREGLKVELDRARPFDPAWSPSANIGWRF